MVVKEPTDPALRYTSPENRGVCGFCGAEEGGYAKRDESGNWQASCWACVRPAAASAPQPKRRLIGSLANNAVVVSDDAERVVR